MKKRMFTALCCCLAFSGLHAQEIYNSSGKRGEARYKKNQVQKGFDPHRLIFGGGLGFGMGYGTLSAGISPIIGYRITDRFAAGIGLGFNYYQEKDEIFNILNNNVRLKTFSSTAYSGSIWGRYLIIPNLFVQAECVLNSWAYYTAADNVYDADGWQAFHKNRTSLPSVLVGAGFRQPVTDNASLYFLLMYDVLESSHKDQSPYPGGLDYRVGFNIGF